MPTPRRFTLEELVIGDVPEAWERAGFAVWSPDATPSDARWADGLFTNVPVGTLGSVFVGGIRINLVGHDGPGGIEGWRLAWSGQGSGSGSANSGDDASVSLPHNLDGLPTTWRHTPDHPSTDGQPAADSAAYQPFDSADRSRLAIHPNGATAIDHVVVMTPDVDRTIDAAEAIGLRVRRTVDTEANGVAMRQTFFVLGTALMELVGPLEPTGEDPSVFFGLAVSTPKLPGLDKIIGDGLGEARPAVQPGRAVRSVKAAALGLSFPMLFMSPRPETLSREQRRHAR